MFKRLMFPISAASVLLISAAGVSAPVSVFAQQNATPAPATGFSVKVTYSQKASDALAAGKETVMVAGYLYGFPKTGTPKADVDHEGKIDVGEVHDEFAPGAESSIGQVKLDQATLKDRALMKWFDTQGTQILINVYSGRKSSPNNLLDCGIYEGSLAAVQGTTIPISCKLIGE
jgi:hypothetical protein